jgi:hypothetical protein
MAININPNRINIQTGKAGTRLADRKPEAAGGEFIVPKRADVNIIPEPESLATLIRSAVAAFRKGVLWDRGTMLNLVV